MNKKDWYPEISLERTEGSADLGIHVPRIYSMGFFATRLRCLYSTHKKTDALILRVPLQRGLGYASELTCIGGHLSEVSLHDPLSPVSEVLSGNVVDGQDLGR